MINNKVFLIIAICLVTFAPCHKITREGERCISDEIQKKVKVWRSDGPPSGTEKSSNEKEERLLQDQNPTFKPIRIYPDYTYANYTKENLDFVKTTLIPYLQKYFEFLLVVQKNTTLKFPSDIKDKMCFNAAVPAQYFDKGVDADLGLFITNENVEGNTVRAWAAYCVRETGTNRPLFGQLNLPEKSISKDPKDWYKMVMTIVHEILHVVGVNKSLFEYFLDESGKERGINNVKKATKMRGVSTEILITPKVVAEVRKHFNCSTLEGAELENEGGELFSHLERRVFGNEIMTSSYQRTAVLSNISLAILEDSGWYKVNYSFFSNQSFGFGRNEGCKFSTEKCLNNETGKSNNPSYFCDVANITGCTYDGFSKGVCSLYNAAQNINEPFDYFPSNNFVTSDPYNDNCPIFLMYSNQDCRDPFNNLDIGLYPESFSATSRCFVGNLLPLHLKAFTDPKEKQHTLCLKSKCTALETGSFSLKVEVQNITLECPQSGGPVTHANYFGTLTCPEANAFCSNAFTWNQCLSHCSKNGKCVNGECVCNDGFLGTDCSLIKCDNTTTCSSHGTCNALTGLCSCKPGWSGANCETKQRIYWCPNCNSGQTDCYGDECVCFSLINRTCVVNPYNITKNEEKTNSTLSQLRTLPIGIGTFALALFFLQ